MIRAMSFHPGLSSLELTELPADLAGGLGLSLWVYRSGAEPQQRLLRLGAPGLPELVLETGAEPDTLVLAQVSGAQRWEIGARGALPEGRWVPVRLTIGSDAAATLDVFGLRVAAGRLGPALARGARVLTLAASTPMRRFTGAFSGVQVYQHARMGAADLWASYPLDDATLLRTEPLRNGAVRKIYRVEDRSGNGRHASTAALNLTTFEGSRGGGASPALRLPSAGAGLSLAPLGSLSGGLSIEVWIRPTVADQPRTLLSLDLSDVTLRLLTGDGNGAVSVDLGVKRFGQLSRSLATARGVVAKDTWSHITFTIERSGNRYATCLYHQGQLRARTSFDFQMPLLEILGGAIARLNLGGGQAGRSGFAGHIAELRVTSGALSEAEVGSRWLRRLCGDEPNLRACYHMDAVTNGFTWDESPRRGLCVLTGNAAIEAAPGLPLSSPVSADGVRVTASGKLVRETLLLAPEDFTRAGLPLPPGRYAGTDPSGQTVSLYDATIEPRAESGQSFHDQPLELRVDEPVTALLIDDQGVARPQRWVPGQTYRQALPPGGILRLRFLASALSGPIVRARIAGMPGGAWVIVRPDAATHDKLRALKGGDLLRPSDGRSSPLAAGTSDADADALAGAVTGLARTLPPVPTASPRVVGEARGLFDDLYGGLKEVVNDASDAVGDLTDAVVDVGQDAIKVATRLPRTAGQLLKWSGSALDDLVRRAREVPARVGVDAITTYVGSADSLAVVSGAALSELAHELEVVGTSIVNGATVVWRVVVSGVKDGLAAIEALCKRIGAAFEKLLEYLAYLFNWKDILDAADRCYELIERSIGALPDQIRQLDSHKARLNKALNSVVDSSVRGRSLGQLLGINVNPDTPGVAELDYVMEQFQRVMSIVDMSATGGAAVGAIVAGAGDARTDDGGASALMSKLPYERLTSPVAVLTTPIGQLVGDAAALSGSGGGLIDRAFQTTIDGASAAVERGLGIARARLYVPGLTPLLEKVVLGGRRKLTVLSIASLVAGICAVLTEKLMRSARGQGRAGVSKAALYRRAAAARSDGDAATPVADSKDSPAPQPSGFEIWVPTALDLINTAIIGWQTYLELSSLGQRSEVVERSLTFWGMLSGVVVSIKGVMWLGLYKQYVTGPLQDYYLAVSGLEVAAGLYLTGSNLSRLKARDLIARTPTAGVTSDETRDKVDAVVLGIMMVGTTITAVLPVALGLVKGQQAQVQYGLRTAVWVMNMTTRGLSFFDNGSRSIKRVTVAAVVLNCATDLTEAIYNHATSTPSR